MLDYGIIGNCHTCALISRDGSIDWMCYPTFSSPSVLAKLLDEQIGGSLSITPSRNSTIKQQYEKDTAILETIFSNEEFAFKLVDFMPVAADALINTSHNVLIRMIVPQRGTPEVTLTVDPRPGYGETEPTHAENDGIHTYTSGQSSIQLYSSLNDSKLFSGEKITFDRPSFIIMGDLPDDVRQYTIKAIKQYLADTRTFWNGWVDSLTLPRQHRDRIIRSAITLKLLTYEKTGAIIAAPTTSIPEQLGTSRCFDYRYCWVRDAAYAVDAFKKIGRDREARRFIDFMLVNMISYYDLQVLYGIDGEKELEEYTLDHLEGFRGSTPVRVGNAAYDQEQHDIFGELLDILYLHYVYYGNESELDSVHWNFVLWLVRQIDSIWNQPDAGIWEFRGDKRHYTYSKMMCYVGVDRAMRIAEHFNKPEKVKEWDSLRRVIFAGMMEYGYDQQKRSFTISYDSESLDAALLQMAYHEMFPPDDKLLAGMVEAIRDELSNGPFVKRYIVPDDFGSLKSAFTLCTFWLIDSLVYIGKRDAAQRLYDEILGYGNRLGLFSEVIDPFSKAMLGNFPQAYTHIALINTSILLSEWSVKRKHLS